MTSLRPFIVVFIILVVLLSSSRFLDDSRNEPTIMENQGVVLSKFQCYTPRKLNKIIPTESRLFNAVKVVGDTSLPKLNKKFLVVIHMTQDSLGNSPLSAAELIQAKNDLKSASGYYSPIKMSFEANDSVYIIENHRFDIIETEAELTELSQLYAKPNRINLFIINRYGGDLEGGCGIAGDYSMFMASGCVNPTSLAHESGHIFGLAHTFGGGSVLSNFTPSVELADGSNCGTAGDFICDTPADPYIPNDTTGIVWIEDCSFVYDVPDANGDYFDPDLGNVMSYYFESCACGVFFTDGQLRSVAETYKSSTSRQLWW